MGRSLCAAVVCLGVIIPAAGLAKQIYSGTEAAALRCSNTLALTAVALAHAQMISDEEKDVMLGVTVRILDRHVSGTWRQKKAALRIMRDRRTPAATLEDYQKIAATCLRQFSIN